MADLTKAPILTGLTNSPRAETLGRYAGGIAGGIIIGIGIGYAMARGWYVPDQDTIKLGAQILVGAALSGAATKMGLTALNNSEKSVIVNTIAAAISGQVPVAIAAKATLEQLQKIENAPAATVANVPPVTPTTKV